MNDVLVLVRATCSCARTVGKEKFVPRAEATAEVVHEVKKAVIAEAIGAWLARCCDHASPASLMLTVRVAGEVEE